MKKLSASSLVLAALAGSLPSPAAAAGFGHVSDPMVLPLFRKDGEIHGRLGTGPGGEGVRAQGGMALTEKVGLIGGTSFANQENCASCNNMVQRHFEIAAGIFSGTPTGWVREGYAGVGTGNFKASGESVHWDPDMDGFRVSSAQYDMAFLQGDVGHRGDVGDILYALRLSAHHMRNYQVRNQDSRVVDSLGSTFGIYLEPAINGRVGFRDYKLDLQLGYATPLRKAQYEDDTRAWVSIGMAFNAFGR